MVRVWVGFSISGKVRDWARARQVKKRHETTREGKQTYSRGRQGKDRMRRHDKTSHVKARQANT